MMRRHTSFLASPAPQQSPGEHRPHSWRAGIALIVALLLVLSSCSSSSEPGTPTGQPVGNNVGVWPVSGGARTIDAVDSLFVVANDGALPHLPGVLTIGHVTADGIVFRQEIAVGVEPTDVVLTHDATRAYTANYGDGTISVVDVDAADVIEVIPLAPLVTRLAMAADRSRLYAATQPGMLYAIDLTTHVVVDSVKLREGAHGLVYHAGSGRIFVVEAQWARVAIVDATTFEVLDELGTSTKPHRIAVNAAATELLVATESSGLEIVNIATNTRVSIAGSSHALAVALTPNGRQAWATLGGLGDIPRVLVVDLATRTVLKRYRFATRPQDLVFAADGTVALISDGHLLVIR